MIKSLFRGLWTTTLDRISIFSKLKLIMNKPHSHEVLFLRSNQPKKKKIQRNFSWRQPIRPWFYYTYNACFRIDSTYCFEHGRIYDYIVLWNYCHKINKFLAYKFFKTDLVVHFRNVFIKECDGGHWNHNLPNSRQEHKITACTTNYEFSMLMVFKTSNGTNR